jgi:hypothetical protein
VFDGAVGSAQLARGHHKEWTLNMLYIPAAGLKVGVGVV